MTFVQVAQEAWDVVNVHLAPIHEQQHPTNHMETYTALFALLSLFITFFLFGCNYLFGGWS